jgi:hypothetical protein
VRAAPATWDGLISQWYETVHDISTPNFREQQARGAIINKPVVIDKCYRNWSLMPIKHQWIDASNSSYGYTDEGYWSTQSSMTNAYGIYQEPSHLWPSDHTLASLGANAAIDVEANIAASEVNLGENLGELGQTMRMFSNIARQLASITSWSRGKQKTALLSGFRSKTAVKDAANAWLQYRYGVRPLISSVQGAAEALQRSLYPRYTARGRKRYYDTSQDDVIFPTATAAIHCDASISRSLSVEVSAGAIYSFKSDVFDRLSGFGFNDLFTLGWEFVPYSFVIDWFIDIGSWLQSLAPKLGVNVHARWVTTRIESVTSVQCEMAPTEGTFPAADTHTCTGIGNFTYKRFYTERVPHRGHFRTIVPRIDISLDVKRLIDSIGLLVQLR